MKNNHLHILLVVIGAIVLFIGIKVRYDLTEKHFGAGVDDLGVATTILDFKESLPKYTSQISQKKEAALNWSNGGAMKKVIVGLNNMGLLTPLLKLRLNWNFIHAVPKSWTYAPLQFYFTTLLINPGMHYEDLKFWARFPSLVFSVSSILVLALFCFRTSFDFLVADRISSVVLAIALSSFSWQHIAYAAQMHSFAIAVLSVSLLFLMLKNGIIDETDFKFSQAFFLGLLLGLLAMSQYQLLIFFPGFVIALLHKYSGKIHNKIILLRLSQILFGFAILAIPFVFSFLYGLSDNGVNWNKGPSDKYLLNIYRYGPDFFSSLYSFFIFFVKNIPEVIMAMLSPVAERNLIVTATSFLLSLLIFTGYFSLFEKSIIRRAFLIFFSITFFLWVVLLLANKITLSPSRHSMVLIPVFILLIILGIDFYIKRIFRNYEKTAFQVTAFLFAAVWLGQFLWKVSDGINFRQDPYEERSFLQKLENDKVDFLLSYEATYNVNLMYSVLSKYTLLEINDPWGSRKEMGVFGLPLQIARKDEFIFAAYSATRPLSMNDLQKFKNQFGEIINSSIENIEIINSEVKNCDKIIPDWAFPLANTACCGFYYTLVKIKHKKHTK